MLICWCWRREGAPGPDNRTRATGKADDPTKHQNPPDNPQKPGSHAGRKTGTGPKRQQGRKRAAFTETNRQTLKPRQQDLTTAKKHDPEKRGESPKSRRFIQPTTLVGQHGERPAAGADDDNFSACRQQAGCETVRQGFRCTGATVVGSGSRPPENAPFHGLLKYTGQDRSIRNHWARTASRTMITDPVSFRDRTDGRIRPGGIHRAQFPASHRRQGRIPPAPLSDIFRRWPSSRP